VQNNYAIRGVKIMIIELSCHPCLRIQFSGFVPGCLSVIVSSGLVLFRALYGSAVVEKLLTTEASMTVRTNGDPSS